MHARRIRPDAGPLDRRRLAAAGLSAVLPGLGQLFNGRRQLGAMFLIPSLLLLAIGLLLIASQSPARLTAFAVAPAVLGTLLMINLLVMIWRLLASGQAFLDTRWAGPTGRLGIIGIVIISILIVVPHLMIWRYGSALGDTFGQIFTADGSSAEPGRSPAELPKLDQRINVLLIGTDKTRLRTSTLTDTMMVASLDPVGKTVTLLSVPRDLIKVPLESGDVYAPKINSLMSYADAHPDEFPEGGVAALRGAIGSLLGIDIPYYAEVRFGGFIRMIDAVGGVDVVVKDGFDDPTYDGYGFEKRGYSIKPGRHHLDGVHALAYARARKALGESDFTRAARQQQILVALRDAVTRDGSLLWNLPGLLDAVGESIRTDVPVALLPQLAAIVDEVGKDAVTKAVIRHPLVKSRSTVYGSSLVPDRKAILKVAAGLFPSPGVAPIPWPTPKPTPTPDPTASP